MLHGKFKASLGSMRLSEKAKNKTKKIGFYIYLCLWAYTCGYEKTTFRGSLSSRGPQIPNSGHQAGWQGPSALSRLTGSGAGSGAGFPVSRDLQLRLLGLYGRPFSAEVFL